MISASALIDDPLQCPKCGQPLKADHDWEHQLAATGDRMLCCGKRLSAAEYADFGPAVRAARETGRG